MSFLVNRCPDRLEPLVGVFQRFTHASLAFERPALDHLSFLIERGVIAEDATVAEAIATLKREHRSGGDTYDRGWQ
jgi:hypothetical protein